MLRGVSVPAQYGQGLLDDSLEPIQKQTPAHLTGQNGPPLAGGCGRRAVRGSPGPALHVPTPIAKGLCLHYSKMDRYLPVAAPVDCSGAPPRGNAISERRAWWLGSLRAVRTGRVRWRIVTAA